MTQTIDTCVKAVFELIRQARAFYPPSCCTYDDLANMMVIDGYFILELLHRSHEHGIGEGDPIFDNILVKQDVKHDLLLLENQIPFCILETLFQLTVKHILRPGGTNRGGVPTVRYSATEIAGAGVTFKPQRKSDSQLAVEFKQSSLIPGFGKLVIRETSFKIPVLRIEDSTPSFLRNLIAYEQCYPLSRHYVTSFAFLMDMLIDTKDDVSLLVRAKVLQHNLGASEDVTNLFNNICKGVVLRDFYYSDEWTELDAYCKRCWPRIFISLGRLYKSTHWKTLTVIAAVAIFALTLLQTTYDVRNA